MRPLLLLSLLALTAAPGHAAQVYRFVSPDGEVVFTDEPRDGATALDLAPVQTYSTPPPAPAAEPSPDPAPEQKTGESAPIEYTRLSITAPADDSAMWSDTGAIQVGVEVEPALDPEHRLQAFIDGELAATAEASPLSLAGVTRGTHTVSVRLVDADGNTLKRAGPVRFTVHQHSRLRR